MKSRSIAPVEGESSTEHNASGVSNGLRRTAVAVAATVGATAALTAVAAPANAEPPRGKVWNRVAECESGKNWDINTGNGFYGGLQFSDSTWDSHGGEKYASRADKATRAEQIEVARRVLKSQGPGAWPVCGGRAGLTKANGDATSAKLPRVAANPDTEKTAAGSYEAKHRSTAKASSKSASHKAKHAKHGTYTVRSGDTLAKIAKKKHVAGGWKALYKANKGKLKNPNTIHVGQKLILP